MTSKQRKPLRSRRPGGNQTPLVNLTSARAKALEIANDMVGCNLAPRSIELITLRVCTNASVAAIAKSLNMSPHHAYGIIASPGGQELVAKLARATLGVAATTALHTLEAIARGKDKRLAMEAAQDLLERAALGISQRGPAPANAGQSFSFTFARTGGGEEKVVDGTRSEDQ